jgi:hypothetical protein
MAEKLDPEAKRLRNIPPGDLADAIGALEARVEIRPRPVRPAGPRSGKPIAGRPAHATDIGQLRPRRGVAGVLSTGGPVSAL